MVSAVRYRLRPVPRDVGAWIVIAVLARVAFWVVTDRVWEDALITASHAVNATRGIGLTHHPGEGLVHGFTSVLSVAIPFTGESLVAGSGLSLQRFVSLIAAGLTIAVAGGLAHRLGVGTWPRQFVLGYLALDQNHMFYGMAGMETQVAVLVLMASLLAVTSGSRLTGVTFGLAILARPDFVIWVVCGAAWVAAFNRRLILSTSLGLIGVVLPWILFATAYYGSPVPHTIAAKAAAQAVPLTGDLPGIVAWAAERVASNTIPLVRWLAPFLEDSLVAAAPLPTALLLSVATATWALAVIGALARRFDVRWLLVAVFAISYSAYRLLLLPPTYFDWYAPPATAAYVLLAGAGLDRLAESHARARTALARDAFVTSLLVLAYAMHIPWSVPVEAAIQREIETGVRVPLASYLATNVRSGESVAAEPAGYIGFYSNVLLYDYPGLTSPTALAAVRAIAPAERSLTAMVDRLRPVWLALRPDELEDLRHRFPTTAELYEERARFGEPRALIGGDGLTKHTIDAEFIVLRLRTVEASAP